MQTLAQNLPSGSTHINWKADIDLPEGTIELRDETGRVLGRIENIGKDPAPVEPRYAIALRVKELERQGNCYRETIREFLSTVLTIKRENQPEWMEYLAERINEVCEAIGEEDRFAYRHTHEAILPIKK